MRFILASLLYKIYTAILPKKGETLPLKYIDTLPNGVPIYTYHEEHLSKITSRYFTALCKAEKSLKSYGIFHNTVTKYIDIIHEHTLAIQKKLINATTENLQEALNLSKVIENIATELNINNKGAFEIDKHLQDIYLCMFYLLPEEQEQGYNEVYNTRKIEMFDQYPQHREVFFLKLKEITTTYNSISYIDTLTLMAQIEGLKKNLTTLNSSNI